MEKKILRKNIIEIRDNFEATDKKKADKIINETLKEQSFFKESKNIFIYIGFGSEIDTGDYIDDFLDSGKCIIIPRIDTITKEMEGVQINNMNDLQRNKYGILEPRATIKGFEKNFIDLVVMPGVAFDTAGSRVGYGGGYYDKFLQNINASVQKVALAYEFQVIDKVPSEDHDIKADFIITEKRIINCKK